MPSARAAMAIAALSRMRRRRGRTSGLERVGEAQRNHGVVLEAVKAFVEPRLLGLRVALRLCAGVARGPQVTSILDFGLPWNMTPRSNISDRPLLIGRP